MTGDITHRPTRGLGLSDRFDPATAQASSCTGKSAFLSRHDAERVIKRRQCQAKKRHTGKKQTRASRASLHAYRCRHCHHWHIAGSAR